MSRFLFFGVFFVIAAGLALHFGFEIPYLSGWVGKLPGDIVIKKDGLTIYLPAASSALISAVLSIVLSLFSRPSK